ncbi:MAG: biotin--[acetyl-CoA-carboxylase] ligase [Maricaulaceae bacterium]
MSAPSVRVERYAEVCSTNDTAKARARAGARPPFWICAERQTAGRGRRGRVWTHQPGNLAASAVYPRAGQPEPLSGFALLAGLAIAEALDGYLEPARIHLKWPNDVLVDGAKIAGVLIETEGVGDAGWLVIGIGVNVSAHPSGLDRAVTDLTQALGEPAPSPDAVLDRLVDRFEARRRGWLGAGFPALKQAWAARAHPVGAPVKVSDADPPLEGVFAGLDAAGALRLTLNSGETRTISAGDVVFGQEGPAHAARD